MLQRSALSWGIFIVLCLFGPALFAQAPAKDRADEAYYVSPYPMGNTPASERAAAFISLFDTENVGNLRVYAARDGNLNREYPFKGQALPERFLGMLPEPYLSELKRRGGTAYAVYRIKGNRGEHYLLRLPTEKGEHTLVLFDLHGEQLGLVNVLAYAYCGEKGCRQQDGFLTDLDGDTDLDILTKYAASARAVPRSVVHLQQDDGGYETVMGWGTEIDLDAYNMQPLFW